MSDLYIEKVNNSFAKIVAIDEIYLELNQYFAVFAEGYKFHPLFKQRRWDGKIRYFNAKFKTLPLGLIGELGKFCADRKYSISMSKEAKESFLDTSLNKEEFFKRISSVPLYSYGEKINFRDFQLLGIYHAMKYKRRLFSSNTASGKSAIMYGIIRELLNIVEKKILLIVPGTGLVEQMYGDFGDYSSEDDDFFIEDNACRLYSGYKIDRTKDILISTWQSLQGYVKDNPEFFEQFQAVLVDEAHEAKAAVISKIMELSTNAEYRLAFTGTVPKEVSSKMNLIGNFGPIEVLMTSKEAIERNYCSDIEINALVLTYDKESSKKIAKLDYANEMDYICACEQRNEYICNLSRNLKGNTLILTARVEKHGKVLKDMLEANSGGKKIYYIFGSVETEVREQIRAILEIESDCIVVANYQILSRGWSVRNLHNIIFGFPSKSFTRVIQSIGRSLRKHESKEIAKLFDIVDNANQKNYAWEHFVHRLEMYAEEQFNVKIVEINIDVSNRNESRIA